MIEPQPPSPKRDYVKLVSEIIAILAVLWLVLKFAFPAVEHWLEKHLALRATYYFGDAAVVETEPGAVKRYRIKTDTSRLFHNTFRNDVIFLEGDTFANAEVEAQKQIRAILLGEVLFSNSGKFKPGRVHWGEDKPLFSDKTKTIAQPGDCLFVHEVEFNGPREEGAAYPINIFVFASKIRCN